MADKTLFGRLRRLFSTNVIVRNVGGKKLKIADTDKLQHGVRSHLVDRYSKMHSGLDLISSGYSTVHQVMAARLGLFKDYETMDSDSIISSALDIYSDESTMKNPYGQVLEIQSDNDNIKSILHNLFYDILNIEFNLWPWVRNLTKYGDFFLHLDISDKYGITNVIPLSPYEVIRAEGEDPENPYYTKFYLETMESAHPYLHKAQSGTGKVEFENFQIAHFRLSSDSNLLPYGKSMLEGARKVWKQVTLMEDAMLIHRVMRAPEKRVFKIDIGNIPPNEVDNYMQRIINKMKKTPFIDDKTGDYNLKFNIQNLTEDFFMPVRGGDSGTQVDSLPGMTYETTEDLEYLKNRLLAALRVPKAFLGYEESLGSKATLAAEDVRFARTIERIQRIVTSELTKIAVVHLYSQGFTDEELVNFELSLTNPSTIYEQEKIELWSNKVNLARDVKDNTLMSGDWIYKNVFNFTDDQIKDIEKGIVKDQKQKFRYSQIESEGNDPADTGEAVGTPSDLAAIGTSGEEGAPEKPDAIGSIFDQENLGRPKEVPSYSKDGSARGRDPLGKVKPQLALSHYDSLKQSLKTTSTKEILKETNESDDITTEYNEFVKKD
tara:strand:- start:36 stop:1850 length:1815 start_codon:yes stop_codon:yes gene_type:complete